mgnify:CR=1 FL=1
MAYSSFSFDALRNQFGLRQVVEPWLPDPLEAVAVPALDEHYRQLLGFPLTTEKARSEVLVMPVLLHVWRHFAHGLTLFSGERIDSEPDSGLVGECDFVFCARPRLMWVEAPVACVIEAKREDLEVGLRQCSAQLLGLQRFNARASLAIDPLVGCTTDGNRWQFVRLRQGRYLEIDPRLVYLSELPYLVGLWKALLQPFVELALTDD